MKLDCYRCDICGNDFFEKMGITGLTFLGTKPGEFTHGESFEDEKHICLECCKTMKNIFDSLWFGL